MTKDQLQKYRELLFAQLHDLENISEENSGASDIVELDQSRQGRLSRMDALQGQAMSIAAKQRRELVVKSINNALKRIDDDDYGYCSHCGEQIAEGRLHIDPTATLCITCAEKNEAG